MPRKSIWWARAWCGVIPLATLAFTISAGAQSTVTDADRERIRMGNAALVQWPLVLDRARIAERDGRFSIAADDVALAIVGAPISPQRDTLHARLRALVQRGAWGRAAAANVDSSVDQGLDRAFQLAYDRQIPVTKSSLPSTGRLVLSEYISGIQCGPCWLHDRAYAALLQRYPATQVVVVAYHDGPGYPIACRNGDSLWSYIASNAGFPGLYKLKTISGVGDLGWVDGVPSIVGRADSAVLVNSRNLPATMYDFLTAEVDRHLRQFPEAQVALNITPSGVSDTGIASVRVDVRVTPNVRRKRLGVRLVLVEDTVRVVAGTNRRLQYAAVRTVAWFGQPRSLFFALPAESTDLTEFTYTFDTAALQRALLGTRETDEDAHRTFPDVQAWRMRPRRLGVVVIVQDRDTKEVLQTAYRRVTVRGS